MSDNADTAAPKLTKIEALIQDAEAAGFTVERNDYKIRIFKRDRRSKTRLLLGVEVWHNDGKFNGANRIDVPAAVALNLRTYGAVRSVLGLS